MKFRRKFYFSSDHDQNLNTKDGDDDENDDEIPLYRNLSDRSSIQYDDDLDNEDEDDDENGSFSIKTKQRIFRTILLWFVLLPASFVCYGDLRLADGSRNECTLYHDDVFVLPCAILVVLMPKMNDLKKFWEHGHSRCCVWCDHGIWRL